MNNGPIFNKRSTGITLVAEILLLKKYNIYFQYLYNNFQWEYEVILSKLYR